MEIPENLPSSVWAMAWAELYKWFGENLRQEELDLMDNILQSVVRDTQDEMARLNEEKT